MLKTKDTDDCQRRPHLKMTAPNQATQNVGTGVLTGQRAAVTKTATLEQSETAANSRANGVANFRVVLPSSQKEWLMGSYMELVAAIIRSGLQTEGTDYLRSLGGRYWCWVGDLDPDAVLRLAANHEFSKYQKYHRVQSE